VATDRLQLLIRAFLTGAFRFYLANWSFLVKAIWVLGVIQDTTDRTRKVLQNCGRKQGDEDGPFFIGFLWLRTEGNSNFQTVP